MVTDHGFTGALLAAGAVSDEGVPDPPRLAQPMARSVAHAPANCLRIEHLVWDMHWATAWVYRLDGQFGFPASQCTSGAHRGGTDSGLLLRQEFVKQRAADDLIDTPSSSIIGPA